MTQTERPHRAQLDTVSIGLRVTAAVILVLTVVLVSLSFSVNAVFATQSDRNLNALLSGRAQLARQLARAGVGPQQIVNRVGADGVLASLELTNGAVFGTPPPTGAGLRTTTTRLSAPTRVEGATLTLGVDTSLVTGARATLRRILLVSALAALLLSAALVALAVRLALRPLRSMAVLAQEIAAGARGNRLDPTRTHTELGQTAQAFDEMLDELEGAEARARGAEERTRAFLADAAHELRTPLTGVQAAAETLLQHRDELGAHDREQLEALLVRETQRAGRLVSDLLAMARLDAGVAPLVGPVDLGAVVEGEVARARLLAPQACITTSGTSEPSSAATVGGDAGQLQGVVRNLLDNARRAAGPSGRVHVGVHDGPDVVTVEVVDDGPGVSPADRERIFDRLVRLDAARGADSGGSGLGLAIARATARAHGGDLVYDEPAGPGARFRLTVPRGAPGGRTDPH